MKPEKCKEITESILYLIYDRPAVVHFYDRIIERCKIDRVKKISQFFDHIWPWFLYQTTKQSFMIIQPLKDYWYNLTPCSSLKPEKCKEITKSILYLIRTLDQQSCIFTTASSKDAKLIVVKKFHDSLAIFGHDFLTIKTPTF